LTDPTGVHPTDGTPIVQSSELHGSGTGGGKGIECRLANAEYQTKVQSMPTPKIPVASWLATLVLGGVLGTSANAWAQDEPSWPQFHGPHRNNRSTETGLPKTWPQGGPRLLFTADGLGHGFASLSIAEGMIYTAGNIEGRTVITALDMTGRILWRFDNGRAWEQPAGGARGTPTLAEGRLYHEGPHGDVVCLDAKTGQKLWGLNILEEFNSQNITWGLSESLLLDADRVICKPGGPETALVALDKRSGVVVWKSPSAQGDLAGYASCVIGECDGLRIILTLTAKALIGIDADSGELLFRHPHESPFDENITMPIYHDGHVFISTRTVGSELLKINVAGNRASLTPVWKNEQFDNQHGGVILVAGHLYGSCHKNNNAKWVCLDWHTGRQLWAERPRDKGSLTYADGMLYTINERGRVILVPALPEQYSTASQFSIPKAGQGPTWAHPVVCDGRLYIRHSDYLYVYDVRSE
jgi:outer membrane protein assembly factor BamB